MKIYLETKPVYRLTKRQIQRCHELTLDGDSMDIRRGDMKPQLNSHLLKGRKSPAKVIFARNGSGHIVGWALVWSKHNAVGKHWYLYMFVAREYRRKGIGTKLMTRARIGRQGSFYVYPHGKTGDPSRGFYEDKIDDTRVQHG